MPKKKGHQSSQLLTGADFVNTAKEKNAKVTPNAHQGFTRIETPQGSMYINPSNDTLDKSTRSNVRKWFRFLGIMIVMLLCLIPTLQNLF